MGTLAQQREVEFSLQLEQNRHPPFAGGAKAPKGRAGSTGARLQTRVPACPVTPFSSILGDGYVGSPTICFSQFPSDPLSLRFKARPDGWRSERSAGPGGHWQGAAGGVRHVYVLFWEARVAAFLVGSSSQMLLAFRRGDILPEKASLKHPTCKQLGEWNVRQVSTF